MWNLDTNECVRTFTGHGDQVKCLEISFDRSKLYSGGLDKTFRVWDLASGKCLKRIDSVSAIYCLKLMSSNFIAVGLYGTIENLQIIDLNSHMILKSLVTHSDTVRYLNINRDENVLFIGSNNGPIRMFQF